MRSIKHTACYLALFGGLLLSVAQAGAATTPVNIAPSILEFGSGQLGHWYVSQSQTAASVFGASAGSDGGDDYAPLGLAHPITATVAGEYDSASAYAAVTATQLHAAAFSSTGQPFTTPSAGGFATVGANYFTILDRPGTIKLTVHLSGTLNALSLGADAGVSLFAMGSGVDDSVLAPLTPSNTDEASSPLQIMHALPRINDAHLQVFTAFQDGVGETTLTIERDFSISAEGFAFACPASGPGTAYCGKYGYAFSLALDTGSVNTASSDFAHTLTLTGLEVPQGVQLSFDAGAAIPVTVSAVPEASASWSALLGLGCVALMTTRRRRADR